MRSFLTEEKLTIIGAAGMIGSNMVQTAIMLGLTPNICAYDEYAPGLEGMAEEMLQCGFKDINLTFTTNKEEALKGASYILSSGGAARKAGMTREDLLKGNAEIAAQLGKDIKEYCPDVKQVTIIFNPADITGLITLIHSGIHPSRLTTLAALDSTRLRSALAQYFKVAPSTITGCKTFGGHGEQMAVFASTTKIGGRNLSDIIGTPELPKEDWDAITLKVVQGGKRIIDLRGRSSFQSPSYLSVKMIESAMGGASFDWPSGTYLSENRYSHILMAMNVDITKTGAYYYMTEGTKEEMQSLDKSYKHLCELRDEVIAMGIIPPIAQWNTLNKNL